MIELEQIDFENSFETEKKLVLIDCLAFKISNIEVGFIPGRENHYVRTQPESRVFLKQLRSVSKIIFSQQ